MTSANDGELNRAVYLQIAALKAENEALGKVLGAASYRQAIAESEREKAIFKLRAVVAAYRQPSDLPQNALGAAIHDAEAFLVDVTDV